MSAPLAVAQGGRALARAAAPERSLQSDTHQVSVDSGAEKPATSSTALLLLGTGVVGSALLELLGTPEAAALRLVGVANSRRQHCSPSGLDSRRLPGLLDNCGGARDDAALLAALDVTDLTVKVIVDATASASMAALHPHWLARGYHVVTANKALAGGDLAGWRILQHALE